MKNPFLVGKSIYLRAAEPDDADIFALAENHPDPRDTLFFAVPTTVDQHRKKIEEYQKDPNIIMFAIVKKEKSRTIGNVGFFRIDWVGKMAIYFIAIPEKENWSRGYGSEVTQLMVDYAFETLNLNRIQLHVYVKNERAVKAYQKAGFRIEGTLREAMYHKGAYCDFYVMGLLRGDLK